MSTLAFMVTEKPERGRIRILHVSDVHCATLNLREVLSRESYDIVMATGDLECVDTAEALSEAGAEVYAITGNVDNAAVYRKLKALGMLLDGRVATYDGLAIGGLGGLDVKSSLAKLERELKDVGRVEILLSHHPPKGILDEVYPGKHAGLSEVRALSDSLKPRLHLFGHIHESRGHVRQGATVYVNAGPLIEGFYAVIMYDETITVSEKKIR